MKRKCVIVKCPNTATKRTINSPILDNVEPLIFKNQFCEPHLQKFKEKELIV